MLLTPAPGHPGGLCWLLGARCAHKLMQIHIRQSLKTSMSKKIICIPLIEESKDSLSDEDEEDGDEDVEPITEFRFVPSDKSACECSVILIFSPCPHPLTHPSHLRYGRLHPMASL